MSRSGTVLGAVLLAAVALVSWRMYEGRRPAPAVAPISVLIPEGRVSALRPESRPAEPVTSGGIPDAPSELAQGLNSPQSDIHADLRMINDIFMHYRSAVHGQNPVGENAEITAVLTGGNQLGFAFIPKDHPAINSAGELCDRWGTPFFFHQVSGEEMEIRSAGPDRKLWTADDQVLTP